MGNQLRSVRNQQSIILGLIMSPIWWRLTDLCLFYWLFWKCRVFWSKFHLWLFRTWFDFEPVLSREFIKTFSYYLLCLFIWSPLIMLFKYDGHFDEAIRLTVHGDLWYFSYCVHFSSVQANHELIFAFIRLPSFPCNVWLFVIFSLWNIKINHLFLFSLLLAKFNIHFWLFILFFLNQS